MKEFICHVAERIESHIREYDDRIVAMINEQPAVNVNQIRMTVVKFS